MCDKHPSHCLLPSWKAPKFGERAVLPPAEGTGNLCFLFSGEDPLKLVQLWLIHCPAAALPGFGAFAVTWTRLSALLGESRELGSCLMWKTTAEKAACSPLRMATPAPAVLDHDVMLPPFWGTLRWGWDGFAGGFIKPSRDVLHLSYLNFPIIEPEHV